MVGKSGCGKSTLARLVTLIEQPSAGGLMLDGVDAVDPPPGEAKKLRRTVRIVFQDPYGSLNPRKRVGTILEEPLVINTDLPKAERRAQALDMMAKVGLRPEQHARYPHMFSGGQRQRIAIARALMLRARSCWCGRAGLGARHVGAGAGAQPALRPAARDGARLPVHLARSRRGAPHRA